MDTHLIEREPVEHLLVLQGPAEHLDPLCTQAFRLAQWLPTPSGMMQADELDVLAFHLTYGDLEEAARIASEIGEDWPFSSDKPTSREVRQFLAGKPELQRNALTVLRNLQTHGYVSQRAWRKDTWGAASDVEAGVFERVQAELAVLRFSDASSRLPALLNMALRRPAQVDVSCIIVDTSGCRQYWFDSAEPTDADTPLKLHEQHFESEEELIAASWLAHKPDRFLF